MATQIAVVNFSISMPDKSCAAKNTLSVETTKRTNSGMRCVE